MHRHHINTKMYFIVCASEERFVTFWAVTRGRRSEKIVTNGDIRGGEKSRNAIFEVMLFLNDP